MDTLQAQRAQLLGETLRLYGAVGKPNGQINVRLALRLRSAARVDSISAIIEYPSNVLTLLQVSPGAASPLAQPATAQLGNGKLNIIIPGPSTNATWPESEYEVAVLSFTLQAGATTSAHDLKLHTCNILRDGQPTHLKSVSGVVFIDAD